jgi:hypothetical protein
VQSGWNLSKSWRKETLPSSGSKSKLSKQSANASPFPRKSDVTSHKTATLYSHGCQNLNCNTRLFTTLSPVQQAAWKFATMAPSYNSTNIETEMRQHIVFSFNLRFPRNVLVVRFSIIIIIIIIIITGKTALFESWPSSAYPARFHPVFTCLVFAKIIFLQSKVVSPASNPQPGGPGLCTSVPQEQGGLFIPPGTGFPFRRLLWLSGLRWRYCNPPPHGECRHFIEENFYLNVHEGTAQWSPHAQISIHPVQSHRTDISDELINYDVGLRWWIYRMFCAGSCDVSSLIWRFRLLRVLSSGCDVV